MIKIRIRNADHEIDIRFPISESELFAKLGEIHAVEGRDAAQSAYVTEVYWPEEFSILKDRFANLDELNYLGKRMESFDTLEYDQFLIGISKLDSKEVKDLINLTFNLNHFTLCQDVSNYGKIGRAYPLTGMLLCPDCGRSYRRQIVRGKAYWMCSGRASGATICSSQRMSESDVYEAFNRMLFKLKKHHQTILGTLIRDVEVMQSKTSENHEKIAEIDKEIADLAARNLVIVRLHTSGILNGSDYSAQSSEINNRISALRSERKKKLAEDEGDEQLDKLKELQSILDEYEPTEAFDEDLFSQIIEKATVMNKTTIAFHLIGGLKLIETIV